MAVETEIIRNFCPHCMKKSTSILYCTKCGSGDLIPEPIGEVLGTPEKDVGASLMPEKLAGSFLEIDMVPEPRKPEMIAFEPSSEVEISINQENTFYEIVDEDKLEQEFIKDFLVDEVEEPKQIIPYKITEENRFHFLTGAGGTGKTFLLRQRAHDNPRYIELCSTTGIAAVNLGGRTINSALKYYDTKSLRRNWETEKLHYRLRMIRQNKDILGIEECSMLPAEQLDLIFNAVEDINNDHTGKKLGIHLIGDFAQLPPVSTPEEPAQFCFKADCWPSFENSIEKLTKVWRQDNPDFIKAINFARIGDGNSAVTALLDCGVEFRDKVDGWYNGTSLIAVNKEVDFYNTKRLNQLNSPMIRTLSKKEGTETKEWDKYIPLELRLKEGAYVMILSNDVPNFNYVNGDTGWVRDYDSKKDVFSIELKRTGACVKIGRIERRNYTDRAPNADYFKPGFSPFIDQLNGEWVIGRISFHPLRLAYASTVHKSQGLSLDLVQIDTGAWFIGNPNMMYVALSRARTPEGLIIVGRPQDVARKIVCSPEVKKWI